jgi:hypothetical protein
MTLVIRAVLSLALLIAVPPAQAAHDRAYWQSIKAHDYAVPAGATAPALAAEVSGLLGSPDPELRDDLAYSILSAWIGQTKVLTPADIRPLITTWTTNLQQNVGASGDNSVLRRSFSALMLSTVALRDAAESFLTPEEHATLVDAALRYLAAERDLRGFDDQLGWIHSAAHTADLLRFLARSPRLTVPEQHAILDGIAAKMHDASVVFTFGEDERYARAVGQITIRADFDLDNFKRWVTRVAAPMAAGKTSVAALRSHQNATNLLSKLAVLLARQPTLPKPAEAARDAVLAAVKF